MSPRNRVPRASWEAADVKREQAQTCPVSGKRIYASEREALATAAHRMADREAGPPKLRTYKCMYCGGWHLTSKQG
jgi:hypothetical protein